MFAGLTNHLWQSTLLAVAAGLLTVAFRKNQAQVRFWLWFSASIKFFIPFSLLLSLGSNIHYGSPDAVANGHARDARDPATAVFGYRAVRSIHATLRLVGLPVALLAVWACGFGAVASIRIRGWRRIRAAVQASHPIDIPAAVEIRVSPGLLEPGVVGLLRPILLLPAGITNRLTPRQLEAVLAHELCHVRRRDNLFASIHMVVEALFWFHPMVWWIGARLVEERERACDEAVVSLGSEPHDYAEGILNVCKLYIESPLVCVSGVTGANLKKRIEAIMTNRTVLSLNFAKKSALAAAAILALAIPLLVGMMNTPLHAQSPATAPLQFEVASIRPNLSGSTDTVVDLPDTGRLHVTNATLKTLIRNAWGIQNYQIAGGPNWLDTERYDIQAKTASQIREDQEQPLIQNLLADRFNLKVHRETRDLPLYALELGKGGPKFEKNTGPDGLFQTSRAPGKIRVRATRVSMGQFGGMLGKQLGRIVQDKTGLDGYYDVALEWDPEQAPDSSEPSIFAALQEQLGLRLESQRGPVEILIVDRAERPSEN